MSLPQIFMYEGRQVRTVMKDGDPWFVAKDVCDVLDISNNRMAIERLDEDEKGVSSIDTLGGKQEMSCVSEPGLYSLILGSRKEEAKQFKRWITHDVLPTIRKHGAYMTPESIEKTLTNPDFIIQLATLLKNEQNARLEAETKLDYQRPLVAFAETCMDSDRNMLVREVAKLASKDGLMIGEKRLYNKLREWGMVFQQKTEPTQRAMEMGIFEVIKGVRQTPKGARDWETSKVTPKGQVYIVERLKRENPGA